MLLPDSAGHYVGVFAGVGVCLQCLCMLEAHLGNAEGMGVIAETVSLHAAGQGRNTTPLTLPHWGSSERVQGLYVLNLRFGS